MRERIAIAIRGLLNLKRHDQPSAADISLLQSWVHVDDQDAPYGQLARIVLHVEFLRKEMRGDRPVRVLNVLLF